MGNLLASQQSTIQTHNSVQATQLWVYASPKPGEPGENICVCRLFIHLVHFIHLGA